MPEWLYSNREFRNIRHRYGHSRVYYECWSTGWFPQFLFEGRAPSELTYVCYNKEDIANTVVQLVDDYGCKPTDILVFPVSAAIPFKFKKVEAVEISL